MTCACVNPHVRKRLVLTGGPGAGKTAVIELVRRAFCEHVRVLPEAAGIVFGGGFPRESDDGCRRAAQRSIFYVQRELEAAADSHNPAIVLCDRGTLDGLAYWPATTAEYFSELKTTERELLARYDAVIHLRTPGAGHGYNHANPLRIESAESAMAIDQRIAIVWRAHPRVFEVAATSDFIDKARTAIEILRRELPDCCRRHTIAGVDLTAPAAAPDGSRCASA
jgi:predicted ATPase